MDVARDVGPAEEGVAYAPPVRDLDESDAAAGDLADALGQLRDRARRRGKRSSRSLDTWTRIEITPEIELSVRGATEKDRRLLERVRRAMMRLL